MFHECRMITSKVKENKCAAIHKVFRFPMQFYTPLKNILRNCRKDEKEVLRKIYTLEQWRGVDARSARCRWYWKRSIIQRKEPFGVWLWHLDRNYCKWFINVVAVAVGKIGLQLSRGDDWGSIDELIDLSEYRAWDLRLWREIENTNELCKLALKWNDDNMMRKLFMLGLIDVKKCEISCWPLSEN